MQDEEYLYLENLIINYTLCEASSLRMTILSPLSATYKIHYRPIKNDKNNLLNHGSNIIR